MYVIFNRQSGKLVGQTLGLEVQEGCASLKVDKDLYDTLMENPSLYRRYKVELSPKGEPRLVESQHLTWASRFLKLEPRKGPVDIDIQVSRTQVKASYSVALHSGVEVVLLRDYNPATVCFHGILFNESPVDANIRDLDKLVAFLPKLAKEYKYGVSLWQEEK